MKKKILAILMIATMVGILAGCGQTKIDATITTGDEQVQEAESEVVEEEKDSDSVGYEIPKKKAEESAPVDEGLTVEVATEKLQKLCDAYNALYDSKDEAAELATRLSYNPDVEPITNGDYHTKDDYSLQNISVDYDRDYYTMKGILLGALWDYYYDRANNDSNKDYPSFISDSNKDDLADLLLKKIDDQEKSDGAGTDTSAYFMNNIVWIPSIMSNESEDVTVENVTDSITVENKSIISNDLSNVDIAYQADIYIKGVDSGLKLVFDKDKNLININDEAADESVIKYVEPFE